MQFFVLLSLLLLAVGHVWFAWMLWNGDQTFMAVLLLIIPIPFVGLFAWWQSDWEPSYKVPAIIYFSGYVLVSLVGLAGPPA